MSADAEAVADPLIETYAAAIMATTVDSGEQLGAYLATAVLRIASQN